MNCLKPQIPVITYRMGQRKDNLAKETLAAFTQAGGTEGVLFAGKPQEKTLFSTRSYAHLIRPLLALVTPDRTPANGALRPTFQHIERAIDT